MREISLPAEMFNHVHCVIDFVNDNISEIDPDILDLTPERVSQLKEVFLHVSQENGDRDVFFNVSAPDLLDLIQISHSAELYYRELGGQNAAHIGRVPEACGQLW